MGVFASPGSKWAGSALLVGTDDMENIKVVRSGEVELKPAKFDACIEAHPGCIALKDRGKFIFWGLKDPTKPPVEGDGELKKKLANIGGG